MRDTLATLLHALDIGVWQGTLPLTYAEPDPTAAGQFGISSAGPVEVEGFLERVDERYRAEVRSALERCAHTREPIDVEFQIAGAARFYRLLGRVNGPDLLDWITVDVTNRYQKYHALVRSEQELRNVLERVSDGFMALDRDWHYLYVNNAAAALVGKEPSELTGKVVWEVFPEAINTQFYSKLHEAMETQQPVEIEEFYAPLRKWIALRAFPSTEGLSVLSLDATARKESDEALRHSEEQFRSLANSMPVLAWIADETGWIYWYNTRWYEFTGTTPEQMEGWGWRSVHDPDQVDRVVERWTASILTGEAFEMVFPLRSHTGDFRQFLTRVEPVRDASGKIIRWFGTNTDITEQERQADEARRDQHRLQAALEASRTGTFSWDVRTNNLEWDDSLDRLLGLELSAGERTMERFLAAVEPEDLATVVRAFHDCARSGQDLDLEFRVLGQNASAHWLYARGRASGTGRSAVMTGACVDITERKSAVEQVKQRARLAALGADVGHALTNSVHPDEMLQSCCTALVRHLDASFARIWTLNESEQMLELRASAGLYTHINGAHANVPVGKFKIGKIAQERLPHLTNDVLHDPRVSDHQWAAREGMIAFAGYPLIVDDDLVGVIALFAKHKLQEDTLDAIASVANSIALGIRRKHTEAELIRAKNDAQSASQAKSHFLASMSHELRTPLNAIIGYSEMLQEEAEELGAESMMRDLGKIHAAGRHLLGIVSDILDLSKIEAGRMDLFFETFDIRSMIHDVASVVDPLVAKNGNTLKLQVPEDLGHMEADLTKVRQALLNLLSNAAKFTENGSITVEAAVEPGIADGQDRIRISVADTGRGIPAEKISELFQPFSQVDRSSARAPGGTGLGLVITRRFCQMMGGDVTVESEHRKGSRFTIVLPRNARSAVATDGGTDRARSAEPSPMEPAEVPAKPDNRATVLVIDDDAAARELMLRYLSKQQFRVLQAANGEDGLKLARQVQPDVITLDVLMPGMDGWTVLQALKADPELAQIPVVMTTMVSDRGLGYALGAADYLLKPVSREKLVTVLRKHASRAYSCRVLVVEDDDAARSMLQTTLQREGWLVDTAADGAQGLARMEVLPAPGLVLLDLMMPNMDGFEFAEAVRKRPEWKKIPIVVLTGQDLTAQDRERLRKNVERIVTKGGHDKETLLSEIRQLVSSCVRKSSEASCPGAA